MSLEQPLKIVLDYRTGVDVLAACSIDVQGRRSHRIIGESGSSFGTSRPSHDMTHHIHVHVRAFLVASFISHGLARFAMHVRFAHVVH